MRSWLFVPGDDGRKLNRALRYEADALILDLEDSVVAQNKEAARRNVLAFLQDHRSAAERPALYVRVNGLGTDHNERDLDVVMAGTPDGIVLPKAAGGGDIALLHARLSVCEALHDVADGTTRVLAIATETAQGVFNLGSYAGSSARLAGLAWGAEDLSTDVGARASRDGETWTEPYRIVRSFCLFAATAADTAAVDTVCTNLRDFEALQRECDEAARDGFSGKLAIHPDQLAAINDAFTPSEEDIAEAQRVIDAFDANDGVATLDGRMLDRPHLTAAQRLLARAAGQMSR